MEAKPTTETPWEDNGKAGDEVSPSNHRDARSWEGKALLAFLSISYVSPLFEAQCFQRQFVI